ncbi:MAG: hypothetical protein Q4E33_02240 [Erysipelotrichaceae bacterium]|nr:hypothetical protein [Erysipelotrichaceae bacterium]
MKDRKDGTLIRDIDPFHSIVPYVMPKRTESEVSITEYFDVTELNKYIKKANKEGNNIKLFHCVCTAFSRTVYHRNKLNIFISGRRFYQRKDITLSFVAKQKFDDEAVETLMFLNVKPDMTLNDISHKILGDVDKVRNSGSNDLDKTMDFVGKLPRPILEFIFFIVRRLEYHGIVPEFIKKGDPNYSTCLLSNLGSIKSASCYHHLSNYGTCSMMVTIGKMETNHLTGKDTLPMTFTIDERIADGFYFAKSLRLVKYILANPETLTEKIADPIPEELFN